MPDEMLRIDCKYGHFDMNPDIIPKAPYILYEMSRDFDSFTLELINTGRLKPAKIDDAYQK